MKKDYAELSLEIQALGFLAETIPVYTSQFGDPTDDSHIVAAAFIGEKLIEIAHEVEALGLESKRITQPDADQEG